MRIFKKFDLRRAIAAIALIAVMGWGVAALPPAGASMWASMWDGFTQGFHFLAPGVVFTLAIMVLKRILPRDAKSQTQEMQ